jgi:hypothetical protein
MNIITTNYVPDSVDQIEDTTSLLEKENTLTTDARKKWASKQPNRESIVFKAFKEYYFETYTQYLDVDTFSVRIPGKCAIHSCNLKV